MIGSMKGRQASGRRPESDRRAQNPSTLQERWELAESDRRDQDRVIAQAFETGASDYILEPFSPTELVARIGAVLRKRTEASCKTRRRWGRTHLHRRRAESRIPHGEGRRGLAPMIDEPARISVRRWDGFRDGTVNGRQARRGTCGMRQSISP